jgi:hypothetical protein
MNTLPRGRQPLLTARDEYEIWQNREAGISIKDCAALAGVSIATVMAERNHLNHKGTL